MKIRTKLLVGYAGFVLALGVLGAWSARTLSQMSAVSGRIISENYDSVVAAQDMKESLERQDSGALFDLLGEHQRARRQIAEHRARFDAALAKAAANITERGEPERIDAIRRDRDEYYRRLDAFLAADASDKSRYFDSLEPQFNEVRSQADALVEFAKREGITHVIFGQSARSRWDLLLHGSIVDRFLRDVRDANVQIVPVRTEEEGDEHASGSEAP